MLTPSRSPEIGGAWATLVRLQLGQAAGLAAGLASVVVVSRVLGPEAYGGLTLLTATAQYVVILSVNWTTSSVVRFGRDELIRTGRVRCVFGTRLAIALAGLGLAVLLLIWLGPSRLAATAWPEPAFGLALVLALALTLADHADGTLQAIGAWSGYAWLGAVEKSAFLLLVVAAAVYGGHGSVRMGVLALIGAQVVRLLLAGVAIVNSGKVLPPSFDAGTAAAIVRYSWPQIFTFSVGYFSAFVEPFLVARFVDVASTGIYNVAYQGSLLGAALLAPIGSMLFPAVTALRSQQREELVVRLLDRLVPQAVCLISTVIALAMIAARFAVPPVLGAEYAGATAPLLVLLVAVAFQCITIMYGPVAAAYDLTRETAVLNVVGGVALHLLPQLWLIPVLGMQGAAVSWVIWYASSAVVLVMLAERRLGHRFRRILLYPLIAPAAAIALLSMGPRTGPAVVIGLVGLSLWWARERTLFRAGDDLLLESVGVPVVVRGAFATIAGLLSRPAGGGNRTLQ